MKYKLITLVTLVILTNTCFQPVFVYGAQVTENESVRAEENTNAAENSEETASSASDPQEETIDSTNEPQEEAESTSKQEEQEKAPIETDASSEVSDSSTEKTEAIDKPATAVPIIAPLPVTQTKPTYVVPEPAPVWPQLENWGTQKNETTAAFIRRIGEAARKVGQEARLYASVMIAQAILETGSGNSALGQAPYYNLFGIKGAFEGESVRMVTSEDEGNGRLYQITAAFRRYPSYQKSFEDYAKLIKEGVEGDPKIYMGTWKEHAASYQEATKALTGVYATDVKYDQKLNELIELYQLTQYDRAVVNETSSELILTSSHVDSDFPEYVGESYPGAQYYADGNCTQYVYNRIFQLGGYVDVDMGNGMDWGATGRIRGYQISAKPKAGSAVSFPPGIGGADGTYGHVAFVEHVYTDDSLLISEMNAAGLGVVSFRIIDQQTASRLLYVMPK